MKGRNLKIKNKLEVKINEEVYCEVLKNATDFNFYKKDGKIREYLYNYEPKLEEWIEVLNKCWDEKLHHLHEMFDYAEAHYDLNVCFGKFFPTFLRMASLCAINFDREANLCAICNEYILEHKDTVEIKEFMKDKEGDEAICKSTVNWIESWLNRGK